MANLNVTVKTAAPEVPIGNAKVTLLDANAINAVGNPVYADDSGNCSFNNVAPADYHVKAEAFGQSQTGRKFSIVNANDTISVSIQLPLVTMVNTYEHNTQTATNFCDEGEIVDLQAVLNNVANRAAPLAINRANIKYHWDVDGDLADPDVDQEDQNVHWDTTGLAGLAQATVTITDIAPQGAFVSPSADLNVREARIADQRKSESVRVSLRRANVDPSDDQALWVAIRNRTDAISFNRYENFIDRVLCNNDRGLDSAPLAGQNERRLVRQSGELYSPLHGVGSYELLKTATQVFLLLECGFAIEGKDRYTGDPIFDSKREGARLGREISFDEIQRNLHDYLGSNTYIKTILDISFKGVTPKTSIYCEGYLASAAECPPLLELIWSYWHEEAMLAQTMNAIALRFQNRRGAAARDPLSHLEIAPLFPLNNLLWGYLQSENYRLSVPRRAYEYDHHYGLTLAGKAIPDFRPADSRSKFLEAYHNLLYLCTVFYKQDDDTTVIADGFPLLNALKEVHLLLAEGAHNQFGDLPWTARAEMLAEQWILSRPEMLRFLHGRDMVPYREGWMAQVDTMKRLQGWTDVTVTHFNELGVYGEQILLSIRYGNWNIETDALRAANWARYWRAEIQNYMHSYRAATGVELRADPTTTQQRELLTTLPTILIQQRLLTGKSAPALPAPTLDQARSFRERRAARRANNG